MAKKFIITAEKFIMGNVDFHKDLVSRMRTDTFPTLGGGRWDADKDKKILYLWGESHDFGFARPEQIKTAMESEETFMSQSLHGFQVKYSGITSYTLPDLDTFTDLLIIDND
jgi:hypothetical protein